MSRQKWLIFRIMENIIVFLIVGGIIIFNLVQNYKKEVKKNKERPKTSIPTVIPEETPIRPFSKKKENKSIDLQPVYMEMEEVIEEVNHFQIKKNEVLSQINHPMVSEIADEEDISDLKMQNEDSAKGYLELETSDECKRAFVHSLIFERKY